MLRLKSINETVQSSVLYLLIFVILVQFIYPITLRGPIFLIAYQILYAAMFAAGVYLSRDSWLHLIITGTMALLFLGFGIAYALDPDSEWKLLVTYIVLVPYLATVNYVLLRYIFLSRSVTRDVLYAATAVYLLLGALFVPIYGLLETVQPGSFVDSANLDVAIQWQYFIYFSYTTLTTVGYGDFLPLSPWARSIANLEAVIGVLYIAIMMARLVSLYNVKEQTQIEMTD